MDDEPDIRSAVAELLELEGYQTLTAADGTEALETVRRLGNGIDLVLLDLTMPGPSGSEVLARIREIDPSIRVILSSGYAQGDWPSGSGGPEPDAFLAKPYRLREMGTLLNSRFTGVATGNPPRGRAGCPERAP